MGVIAGLAGVAVGVDVGCKNQLSRWIGVALLGLEAIGQLPRMRGDRLVSATVFTLGTIALSALIWYGKRIRQLDITVLFSQGSVDAEVSRARCGANHRRPEARNRPTSMVSRARRKKPEHGLLGGAPSGT